MIVVDSSFLIGYHNQRDAHHAAARRLMERFLAEEWGNGLLLEYVVLEVATVLLARRDLGVAAAVCRLLLDAAEFDFVPCSHLFSNALDLFRQQVNTRLSFADAAITYVARERAGGLVLTFDQEFAQLPGIRVPGANVP